MSARKLAKQLKNKIVLIEFVYAKEGEHSIRHNVLANGVVVTADLKNGVTIVEHGTGNRIELPPYYDAWQAIPKASYKNPHTGEVVRNAEYKSLWIVDPDTNQTYPGRIANTSTNSSYSNFYGIGTKLYGQARTRDGAYISTKWIIFLFIPVYPIASFRLTKRPTLRSAFGAFSLNYSVAYEVALNSTQVIKGYLFTLAAAAFIALMIIQPLG